MVATTSSVCDTSADVREMRVFLLQMMRDKTKKNAIDALLSLVLRLRKDNNLKAQKIASLLRARFGSTTEKLSRAQLDLFLQTIADAEADDSDDDDLPELP